MLLPLICCTHLGNEGQRFSRAGTLLCDQLKVLEIGSNLKRKTWKEERTFGGAYHKCRSHFLHRSNLHSKHKILNLLPMTNKSNFEIVHFKNDGSHRLCMHHQLPFILRCKLHVLPKNTGGNVQTVKEHASPTTQ